MSTKKQKNGNGGAHSAAAESTALAVPAPQGGAPAATPSGVSVLAEMFGPDGLTLGDLPRAKVPAGGGKFFDLDGQPAKEIVGALVWAEKQRTFWRSDEPEQGELPACWADAQGVGHIIEHEDNPADIGGACKACPHSQFDEEIGKSSCKEGYNVFLAEVGKAFPRWLRVPRMSMKTVKAAAISLSNRHGGDLEKSLLSFTLATANRRGGGGEYSTLTVMLGTETPEAVQAQAREFRPQIRAMLAARRTFKVRGDGDVAPAKSVGLDD